MESFPGGPLFFPLLKLSQLEDCLEIEILGLVKVGNHMLRAKGGT